MDAFPASGGSQPGAVDPNDDVMDDETRQLLHDNAEMERKLKALLSTSDDLAEEIRTKMDEMELDKCHELATRWEFAAHTSRNLLEAAILEHDPLVQDRIRMAEKAQRQAQEQLRLIAAQAGLDEEPGETGSGEQGENPGGENNTPPATEAQPGNHEADGDVFMTT